MSAMWNSLIEESETILKKIDKEIDKLKTLKIKKELEVDTRVNLSKEIAELKDDIEVTKEASDFIQTQLNQGSKQLVHCAML